MTKDKARKLAARQRAAVTGERYVVARRAVELGRPVVARDEGGGVLHRLTHRVPGVPAHVDGGLRGRANPPHRAVAHANVARGNRVHGEPGVLVGWQQRIARLLRAG